MKLLLMVRGIDLFLLNNHIVTATHIPTGISASCDSHRSQHKNRIDAMVLLKSRLWANLNLIPEDNEIKYDFPDEVVYPNNIEEFKEEMK